MDWFRSWLADPYFGPLITMNVVIGVILGTCSYLILLERKLSAWMQDRIGPNRTGPLGLLQPMADGIKLLLKEDVIPNHVNPLLYIMAPAVSCFTTLLAFCVVPFGPVSTTPGDFPFIIAPGIDLGIVFIFSVTSLAVYGIILGGWSSNNKYSALGSLRASAQVVSYEIPLGMSVVGLALLSHTMSLEQILLQQAQGGLMSWNIWFQPLACLLFFTAALAESNRLPFDLAECEQELVGGWHTEYSSMKWALFFLAEYTHMITVGFLTIILFFGGWHFPFIAEADSAYFGAWIVKVGVLLAKVAMVIVLIQMLRWTVPRFRFDQLMGLAWKGLIPLAMLNVLSVMVIVHVGASRWWLPLLNLVAFCVVGALGSAPIRGSQRVIVSVDPTVRQMVISASTPRDWAQRPAQST